MPKDERDTVCLADAWNYQQARISLLEAAGAKIISAIRAGLSQDELEAMEEFELLLQEDK
jgi:hypothetical protein